MQRLLLDTHVLLWWLSKVSELAENARNPPYGVLTLAA